MNRSRKGINTFEGYQQKKQESREKLIEQYLATCEKSRVSFRYVTDLAKMVSVHISREEQKNCNPATLLRNSRYKALLLSYMAATLRETGSTRQMAANQITHKPSKDDFQSHLEETNLRHENQRLKNYVASLEGERSRVEGQIPASSTSITASEAADYATQANESHEKFIKTCQVLSRVLEAMKDIICVDMEKKQILNRARRRDNIIADDGLTAPFIEWLKAVPSIRQE